MRSKLKLSRSLEFISAFFKEQQVINTRGGANLAPLVMIGLRRGLDYIALVLIDLYLHQLLCSRYFWFWENIVIAEFCVNKGVTIYYYDQCA